MPSIPSKRYLWRHMLTSLSLLTSDTLQYSNGKNYLSKNGIEIKIYEDSKLIFDEYLDSEQCQP